LWFQDQWIGRFMPRLTNYPDVQIDSVHSRAICQEVGYRLRQLLKNPTVDHPRHLQLLDRMHRQDFDGAPSIVPSSDAGEARSGAYWTSTARRKRTR
jgi:hypothetical protein